MAGIRCVTLTRTGLFADIETPEDTEPVEPAGMIGGEVLLQIAGLDAPAGSLIKVAGGRLDFVEVYTYGITVFPDDPQVFSFDETLPLPISNGQANER